MDYLVLVQDGHGFEADKDDPQSIAYNEMGDMHGGPTCVICEQSWCQFCDPDIFKEKCPERETETLPGMEWRQPMIIGIVGRRKPIY